jgi:predicted anti-sigma-YlaC factor YlaD
MLTCKQVSVLLSQAQDGELGAFERAGLEAHLKVCRGCENFRDQLEFLRRAVRKHPSLRDPGDDGR